MAIILTEDDKYIKQPSTIDIPLMKHQRTIIKKMLDVEEGKPYDINYCLNIYKDIKTNGRIITNIGILGDKVGAGKTLTIISLLSIQPQIKDRMKIQNCNNINLMIQETKEQLKKNLIIVPSKLVPQWKENFNHCNNLNVYTISTQKHIDNIINKTTSIKPDWSDKIIEITTCELSKDKIKNYDVILISDTIYKKFYNYFQEYKWDRIIIDEADTLKLPCNSNITMNFNFAWAITGTPNGLKTKNYRTFIGEVFNNKYMNYIIFKNDEKYVDSSIVLPHPNLIKIKCLTPKELLIIKDLIPFNIIQMINAGNTELAIKTLNCNVDTNENILQVITKNILKTIETKTLELKMEKKNKYIEAQQKEQQKKIKNIENSLEKLKDKYEDIKKKVYKINDDCCPICLGSFTKPIITNCCKNCFCFDCIAISLGEIKNNKCPNCRQNITKDDIFVINNKKTKKSKQKCEEKEKEKLETLVELIEQKPEGKIMIFANYKETFNKIELKLKEMNISYHILKGQASVIKKHIEDFENGKTRVLMLNAQYFGAGMNLQMTTDLIIYHRFTAEMEEQIVGRAQRLGRTTALNVYYLIHENETNEIENKFNYLFSENEEQR